MTALNQAITNHNYSFVRQQAIDSRLVPYGQEVRSVRLFYFCNLAKMDRALRLDPRAAQMIPYRVTLVETPTGVDMMAVNPAWIAQNLGNPASAGGTRKELKRDYLSILDEATPVRRAASFCWFLLAVLWPPPAWAEPLVASKTASMQQAIEDITLAAANHDMVLVKDQPIDAALKKRGFGDPHVRILFIGSETAVRWAEAADPRLLNLLPLRLTLIQRDEQLT
jgi:uncharacterized protein (DUF302 family)